MLETNGAADQEFVLCLLLRERQRAPLEARAARKVPTTGAAATTTATVAAAPTRSVDPFPPRVRICRRGARGRVAPAAKTDLIIDLGGTAVFW